MQSMTQPSLSARQILYWWVTERWRASRTDPGVLRQEAAKVNGARCLILFSVFLCSVHKPMRTAWKEYETLIQRLQRDPRCLECEVVSSHDWRLLTVCQTNGCNASITLFQLCVLFLHFVLPSSSLPRTSCRRERPFCAQQRHVRGQQCFSSVPRRICFGRRWWLVAMQARWKLVSTRGSLSK